ILPPVLGAALLSLVSHDYRGGPDSLLGFQAQIALFTWYLHGTFLLAAAETFGSLKVQKSDQTNAASDLMDSAPLPPNARFAGEVLGIFESTAIIHACCLPMLAVVAALSPLPARVFVWLEAIVIALMVLASAGGAWKRIARPSKMSATRLLRSFIVLLIFFGAILVGSTRWVQFRDAAFGFLGMPSMRAWSRVTAAIDSPVALIMWLVVLYAGYFLFYYLSSTRDPFRA
ncbi:MAG TPA: hypothetical protein VJ853_03575, partial [Thermoanaerobaculia bacterium]|nr:hypothetical protein [Thermoanaerobaculia bacterium]